ncbi:response regulator [Natronosalvus vescus]|uniref:response regulator n=1 Tax=Natronosalvus vescus TaxID=2953881 RepID=UPI0020911529|nr:response regulator [Natronosalvus vescus]
MDDEPLEVLVIEDNRGDVRLIEAGFAESSVDCFVTVLDNGEEALDYLFQRNGYESTERPDLVLLDLNVPKRDGRAVLGQVQDDSDFSAIPFIVLTGSQSNNHVLETYHLGAAGYFVKPVDPNEFISLVETIAVARVSSETVPSGEYADIDSIT